MTSELTISPVLDYLASHRMLPSIPRSIVGLLELNPADPDFFDSSCGIIRRDPALAAHVLKIANCTHFAGQCPSKSVREAMIRVGARMIGATLTESHLLQVFNPRDKALSHLWFMSAFSANLARILTQTQRSIGIVPEIAYTYGLLHDVGRFLLAVINRDAAAGLISRKPSLNNDLLKAETDAFGITHTLAGRILADEWELPEELRLVIGSHHIDRTERRAFRPEVARAIDLMEVVDDLVHLWEQSPDETPPSVDTLEAAFSSPDWKQLLRSLDLMPPHLASALTLALSVVKEQRNHLGMSAFSRHPRITSPTRRQEKRP